MAKSELNSIIDGKQNVKRKNEKRLFKYKVNG